MMLLSLRVLVDSALYRLQFLLVAVFLVAGVADKTILSSTYHVNVKVNYFSSKLTFFQSFSRGNPTRLYVFP